MRKLLALALALSACQTPETEPVITTDAGLQDIALHGRVVDFETCMDKEAGGCQPVPGLKVRLNELPDYVSGPTDGVGRFRAPAPPEHQDHLVVEAGTGYAVTLNPWTAPEAVSDVYGIELYVLPSGTLGDGSETLLAALAAEGFDLVTSGGYVGQVIRIDEEGWHAVMGAKAIIGTGRDWPEGAARPTVGYIDEIPRYGGESSKILLDRESTGGSGIFVVETGGQTGLIDVGVETEDTIFSQVVAPVGPGAVTMGIHLP